MEKLTFGVIDALMRSNRGPGSDSGVSDLQAAGGRVTHFYRRGMNYRANQGGQSAKHDPTDETSWGVRRRSVDDALVDYLASGDWQHKKAGATGNDRGKPVKGVTRPDLIAAAAVSAGWSRAEIRRLLVRGNPLPDARVRRPELAKAVAHLLARPCPLNVAAFSKWIGCNPSTVYALRIRGEKLLEGSAPRLADDLPWCFVRPTGFLKCSRGHGSYSPQPAAWIGRKCDHERTCTEPLRLVQDPNSNVIPLRGEAQMFLTDEQFALDAERLATLTERLDAERREIVSIASRLQARFPADRLLAEAVDQFIGLALESKRAA